MRVASFVFSHESTAAGSRCCQRLVESQLLNVGSQRHLRGVLGLAQVALATTQLAPPQVDFFGFSPAFPPTPDLLDGLGKYGESAEANIK